METKKRNNMISPTSFVEDTKAEMRKVTWPNVSMVTSSTLMIVFILIVLTGYIAGLDFILGRLTLMLNILV